MTHQTHRSLLKPFAIAFCCAIFTSTSSWAQVHLSAGVTTAEAALRAHPKDAPLAFVIDTETISPTETESLLHAIDDRQRESGVTIAIIGNVTNGASLIALACDALVTLSDGGLGGVEAGWCTSASRREDLELTVRQLGRLTPVLAWRLLNAQGPLSWDPESGYEATAAGPVRLAAGATKLDFSAGDLERTGLSSKKFADLPFAMKAVEAGLIPPRKSAQGVTTASAPQSPASASEGAEKEAPAEQATPIIPRAARTPLADRKLSEALKDYSANLTELKSTLSTFDRYYTGVTGIWTTRFRGLKVIWTEKTGMTADGDTKTACERLQRRIRELANKLETTTKTIRSACGDAADPNVVRVNANLATLVALREAITTNKVDQYEQSQPEAVKLQ